MIAKMTEMQVEREQSMNQTLEELKAEVEKYRKLSERRYTDIDKKLIRWRARTEFPSHQDYISYVLSMLDKWDARFGRVFVTVVNPKGKSAKFYGCMGEPVKWTNNLCWVRWLAVSTKGPPEGYAWDTLDVFLPE